MEYSSAADFVLLQETHRWQIPDDLHTRGYAAHLQKRKRRMSGEPWKGGGLALLQNTRSWRFTGR